MTSKPSLEEIVNSLQEAFQERIGVTNFSEGSAAGLITNMIATELTRLYDLLTQAEAARDIELATGSDLDNLARPYGILRRPATVAGTDSGSAQILLTNQTGSPMSISSNMALWPPGSPGTRFYTTNSVTVPAGQSVSVFVQASRTGDSYNVGIGQLTAHNGPAGLAATNILPVTGGSYQEDDTSFRYRISQVLQASLLGGPSSLSGVEATVTSLPGISDAILLPEARGPGTLDVLVIPNGNSIPDDDFLTSVQEELAQVTAAGVSVRVKGPTIVGITSTINVSTSPTSSAINPSGPLRTTLSTITESYINSLSVGLPQDSSTYYKSPSSSATPSSLSYSTLLAQLINAALATLGSSFQNLSLTFSVDGTREALMGDLYARSGEIFRSTSVSVRIGSSTS